MQINGVKLGRGFWLSSREKLPTFLISGLNFIDSNHKKKLHIASNIIELHDIHQYISLYKINRLHIWIFIHSIYNHDWFNITMIKNCKAMTLITSNFIFVCNFFGAETE